MKRTGTRVLCLAAAIFLVRVVAAQDPPAASLEDDGNKACSATSVAPADEELDASGLDLDLSPQDPLHLTCTLQIECADGSVISCMGNNSCTTSGDGRCTVCDGVQTACCAVSCCEVCDDALYACTSDCGSPSECFVCLQEYNQCVSNCTGGCA